MGLQGVLRGPAGPVGAVRLEDPLSIYRTVTRRGRCYVSPADDVADAGSTPVASAPFVGGQPAPDSGVLAGLDAQRQTCFNDLTPVANSLCLRGLVKLYAGFPNREDIPGSTSRQAARFRQVIGIGSFN
jgi:hypothetical protein